MTDRIDPLPIHDDDGESVCDGFGGCWQRCNRPDCDLHVVRPGKVQCSYERDDACDWDDTND